MLTGTLPSDTCKMKMKLLLKEAYVIDLGEHIVQVIRFPLSANKKLLQKNWLESQVSS